MKYFITALLLLMGLASPTYAQVPNAGGERSDCFLEANQCTYIDYAGCDADPFSGTPEGDNCWHPCAASECAAAGPVCAPNGPVTLADALARAKQQLSASGAWWSSASDQAVKDAVCGSPTLFPSKDTCAATAAIGTVIRKSCPSYKVSAFSIRVNLGDSAAAARTPGGVFGLPGDWIDQPIDHTIGGEDPNLRLANIRKILAELTPSQVTAMTAMWNSRPDVQQNMADDFRKARLGCEPSKTSSCNPYPHPELYALLRFGAFNNKEWFSRDDFQPGFVAPVVAPPVSGTSPVVAPPSGTPGVDAPTGTVAYKISETVAGLDVAVEKPYAADANGSLLTDYTFINPKVGANIVFVSFKDTTGKWGGCGPTKSQPCSAQIDFVSQPSLASCIVDTSKPGQIAFDIYPKTGIGNGYGATTGKVELGDVDLQTLKLEKWDDNHIRAILSGQPTDQEFQIKITDSKGLAVQGFCSSLSQLSLGTKLFCRAPQLTTVNDVSLVLAEGKDKGAVVRTTVTIDKKGLIQGLSTNLVEGQGYKISIKAPKSVRKNIEFFAGGGTTVLNNIKLPVGDIFPLGGGDGKINSADAAELIREWIVVGAGAEREGDFNGDGLVNSFDWACQRYDFGSSDEPEVTAGPISGSAPKATSVQNSSLAPIGVGTSAVVQ